MDQLSFDFEKMKVHSRENFYVPFDEISAETRKKLRRKYSFYFFEEKACDQCEHAELRRMQCGILPECETCAAFLSGLELCKPVKVGGKKYLTVPAGDEEGLRKILKGYDFEIKYHQKDHPIKPFHCTANLYDYQKQAIDAMIKAKRGVLKSPPRTGKTLMATAITAQLQKKTLIIASQREWLNGFLETYIGSKTQQGFTDIDPKRIGFCKTVDDFKSKDICLATVQSLYAAKNADFLLRQIRDMFSIVIIDEIHSAAAQKYSQVVNRLNCEYMFGLSGTPDRKDGRYVIVDAIVGPVRHEVSVNRLTPTVRVVKTSYYKEIKGNKPWAYIVGPMERDKKRQKLIAEYALEDVKNGHMVCIPYTTVKAILSQVEIINQMAGKQVAKAFYGSIKKEERDQIIQEAREYKLPIIVGSVKLVSTGVNIPRMSAWYYGVSPASNLPSCRQRVSRILTPYSDKPQPLIRIFCDDMVVAQKCMANEWWNCILPEFKPAISPKDYAALKGYLSKREDKGFKLTLNQSKSEYWF